MEEVIERIVRDKIEELAVRLRADFQTDLQKALEDLRGNYNGPELDGIKCLRSSQVRALLEISESTLYRMRRSNQIGFILKNGTYYYKVEDVLAFLADDTVESLQKTMKKRGINSSLSKFFN